MKEFYYILGAIVYLIFIIQAILAILSIDIDFDSDFDSGSLFTPKGIIHFLMGFTGWICSRQYIGHEIGGIEIATACMVGISSFIALALLYIVCYSLKYEPKELSGKDLIGTGVTIYLLKAKTSEYFEYYASTGTLELVVRSTKELELNTKQTIIDYKHNTYFI